MSSGLFRAGVYSGHFSAAGIAHTVENGTPNLAALIGMGARITLCDPHRAVVTGPSTLHGSELVSPDVRAGMALVIAACCARGESLIRNVYQIERGYEHLVDRFRALGVHIERKPVCV